MSESAQFVDTYKVPVIAKLLHALPHYNITFHRINNTFRPNDEVYREVRCKLLLLWQTQLVPLMWAIWQS